MKRHANVFDRELIGANNMIFEDIFIIPYKQNFILFAPLKKRAILLNKDALASIREFAKDQNKPIPGKIRDFLLAKDIIYPEHCRHLPPTEVNLLLTSDCNLRCKYCFSNGGDTKNYMTWDIAKAAIDYVFRNAVEQKKDKLTIYFQGSGEPTLNWDVLVKSIEYGRDLAKSRNMRTNFKVTTNGIFSRQKADWLAKNMDFTALSFDGPGDIQNNARCFPDGRCTLDIISNTAKIFDKYGSKYNIHSTISKFSVNRMVECVEFFADNFKTKCISFCETECYGRTIPNSIWAPPTQEEFLRNFLKARRLGEKKGVGVYCNKANLRLFFTRFGGSGRFFLIGPKGYVTSTNEADDISRPIIGKQYVYGHYRDGKLRIDEKILQKLDDTYMRNLSFCKKCFCLYNCCVAFLRRRENIKNAEDFEKLNGEKCNVIREVIKDELIQSLSKR